MMYVFGICCPMPVLFVFYTIATTSLYIICENISTAAHVLLRRSDGFIVPVRSYIAWTLQRNALNPPIIAHRRFRSEGVCSHEIFGSSAASPIVITFSYCHRVLAHILCYTYNNSAAYLLVDKIAVWLADDSSNSTRYDNQHILRLYLVY
jgi:hypothetical protein